MAAGAGSGATRFSGVVDATGDEVIRADCCAIAPPPISINANGANNLIERMSYVPSHSCPYRHDHGTVGKNTNLEKISDFEHNGPK
ncbi:hypothetical protein NDN01_05875 [Sphingomonas sp. QA11]|uniref:hypothetical protein n=1 Tax=Sphingomonas sp. QA11 TaxID=2950605 RepID=UPI00234AC07F|nr:hypothetical protein [Sphingomonas sp. QA11]WCM28452.1 hypothetical protein NDN01_05875 [Sphingomonas sp. QA11]